MSKHKCDSDCCFECELEIWTANERERERERRESRRKRKKDRRRSREWQEDRRWGE